MNSNDHTFVIPAYKESSYLEECIISLKQQTVKSRIIIATSTPSVFLEKMAAKYELELFVNDTPSGIAADWNFALSCVKTQYCTIAHQDDIYYPEYAEKMLYAAQKKEDSEIVFCDYLNLIENTTVTWSTLLLVKRIILAPFYMRNIWRSKIVKRGILSFGCSICCPSVLFNLRNLKGFKFNSQYEINLDWDAWLYMAHKIGSFIFVPQRLMAHRISPEAETSIAVADKRRPKEDIRIMERLWGSMITKLLIIFYSHSYNSDSRNDIKNTIKHLSKEIFRYVIAGLTTMLVCFSSAYLLIKKFEVHYLIASNMATLLAWGYSYVINKYFVFKNTERKHLVQGSTFVATQITFLFMANVIIFILMDLLKMPYPAAFMILASIMAVINFITMKLLVFRKSRIQEAAEKA